LASGFFSPDDSARYQPIVDELTGRDTYKHCADFDAYWTCQEQVDRVYRDQKAWLRMVVMNLASVGKFSSDRTIKEYAKEIWGIRPCAIRLDDDWD
jgi:starch phosphorylase